MSIKRQARGNVLTVRFDDIAAGWEQWVLLTADRHHDNIYCDRAFERKHLEQAKERGAGILDFGDLFCAMEGKYDLRSNMDAIRPENVGQDYLDRLVLNAAKDYAPYAENWWLMGQGNHEASIRRHHGMDLTSALAHRLNTEHGARVVVGGYGGWVRLMFTMNKTKRQQIRLKYHHGAGGGGPVTRGVIQTNRQAVYLPDADIVVNGHTHDGWYMPIARERITNLGKVTRDIIHFVRTPGYKDEYGDGSKGFHIEKWGPPKPLGAIWLRLWFSGAESKIEIEVIPSIE